MYIRALLIAMLLTVAAFGQSSGSQPGGGGSGTITSGTINTVSKYTAATTLGNSALTDDGTTLTYSGSGGLVTSGTTGSWTATEGTAPAGVAASDVSYADSTAHRLKAINNNGAATTYSLFTDNLGVFAAGGAISVTGATLTGANAGFFQCTQGTAQGHATANTITTECPAAVTAYESVQPGVAASGTLINNNTSSVVTQGFSGDTNHSATVTIGSGTSITSTSLCSTTFCPVGTYRVNVYVDLTTPCGTSGTYVVNLIYTDDVGSKTIPVNINGTGAVPATGVLTTTSTSNFGENAQIIRSTGAASINYSTTAVACGTAGPMVGKLYLSVEPVQ
jgi:hypothetical protein